MQDEELERAGRQVLEIYSSVCNRVLRVAQAALPENQFQAFRRLVLDEFGEQGAGRRVRQLFKLSTWDGVERIGK